MKYTDAERQEIFNEWLQQILNRAKIDAMLANSDVMEFTHGSQMHTDSEFVAEFKIILRRKGVKND